MKKNLIVIYLILLLGSIYVLTIYADSDHDHHKEDEHQHEHEDHNDYTEHQEATTIISPNSAQKSGIELAVAKLTTIDKHITLTGRIGQNRNTTISVPARFPSIVDEVYVTWGEKVKKGQNLAVLQSRANLTPYNIASPIDGVIVERNANKGELIEDEPMFVVADLSTVWAEFHVFPRDLAYVKEQLDVHVKALESDQETTAPISTILPTADAFSQTVLAVVEVPNKDNTWRPGITVEGDVHLAHDEEQVLAVEESAIQRIENQHVIFVQKNGNYETRPVTLGQRDGQHVEIITGLQLGETYVSKGSFIIKADIGKAAASHSHAH